MKSNLKSTFKYLGLNPKKEILKTLGLNVFAIAATFAFYYINKKSIPYIVVGSIATLLLDYLTISSYFSKKSTLMKERNDEFITVINYLQTYIRNKQNIYTAFKRISTYCSEWMADSIHNFMDAIDEDKSLKPYTDFANLFTLPSARNIMLSIYSMVEEGETPIQLTQFLIMFGQVQAAQNETLKENKEKSLGTCTIFPLIGAGAITLIVSITILSSLGDIINVI